ncbi:chromosome 17 open reading frame 103 [Plakobranchus ocellatus]|uniref:Protein NATD1 n=1 Tax=Plakobranchus ocellatus TaxID=259542 RepID=A0AAV3YTR2_9GAST|nr:chromosome 17 open reading frame 103 [Plakobranchus ocellatus]
MTSLRLSGFLLCNRYRGFHWLHCNSNWFSLPKTTATVGSLSTVHTHRSKVKRGCCVQVIRHFRIDNSNTNSDMSVPRTGAQQVPYIVGHDSKQKMFYIKLQDECTSEQPPVAKLEYEWLRPGLVDLHHTEVPPAFQGRGIAKVLVLAGLDHFCEKDVLIRPTCTYVQKVLRENLTPCYKEHVEEQFLSS